MSDLIAPQPIEVAAAIPRKPRGQAPASALARVVARLGGWNGYDKPPGPRTKADDWRRLAGVIDGYQLAQRGRDVWIRSCQELGNPIAGAVTASR